MGRTDALLLALTFLAGPTALAHAKEAQSVPAGTLVRVTAPSVSKGRLTGTLLSANDQEVVLALPGSEPRTIPRSAMTRLEWSRGYHRNAIPGALVGGGLGGVFLGALSYAMCDDPATCSVYLPAVGVGVALGALPGAGIGALIRTRDWKDVEPARVQLSLAPLPGRGVAAKLSVRF